MVVFGNSHMKIRGYCLKCDAPIFMNQSTDCYGNTVTTLNCWNGHYKWIKIEDVEECLKVDPDKNLVKHIGFFNVA